MKKYIILLLYVTSISWIPLRSYGQHSLSYNQFGQLRTAFNGSLSLMDPNGAATLLTRQQWVGVDGAPQSYWVSGHMGVKRFGATVGVDMRQVSLGVEKERELSAYVASGVRLSDKEYLALSLGGGILMHTGEYSKLAPSDPLFAQDTRTNQGIMSISTSYFKEDTYYLGISIPRFVLNKRHREQDYHFRQVYYATGGALVRIDEGFHLRPSFIVSHMEGSGARFDINALAFFAQKFGVGLGVQNKGDLAGLLQLNIGNIGVGYSYQFSPGSAVNSQRISSNTHEVGVRYRVGGIKML